MPIFMALKHNETKINCKSILDDRSLLKISNTSNTPSSLLYALSFYHTYYLEYVVCIVGINIINILLWTTHTLYVHIEWKTHNTSWLGKKYFWLLLKYQNILSDCMYRYTLSVCVYRWNQIMRSSVAIKSSLIFFFFKK